MDMLESVDKCLICGCFNLNSKYDNLIDYSFGTTGTWKGVVCSKCDSFFLTPRFTKESIHLAYKSYYTHLKDNSDNSLNIFSIFLRDMRECIYSSDNFSFSRFVKLFSKLRFVKNYVFTQMRELPVNRSGSKVLDIGCGGGDWLNLAKMAGWETYGIEPDLVAANMAMSLGHSVRVGDISIIDTLAERFDFITLSHSLEHVHDPKYYINTCFQILSENGSLWIETPNINSFGANKYGEFWRGLEPPRHLTIFNFGSLKILLNECGFDDIRILRHKFVNRSVWNASEIIKTQGLLNYKVSKFKYFLSLIVSFFGEKIYPDKREFIGVLATKKKAI